MGSNKSVIFQDYIRIPGVIFSMFQPYETIFFALNYFGMVLYFVYHLIASTRKIYWNKHIHIPNRSENTRRKIDRFSKPSLDFFFIVCCFYFIWCAISYIWKAVTVFRQCLANRVGCSFTSQSSHNMWCDNMWHWNLLFPEYGRNKSSITEDIKSRNGTKIVIDLVNLLILFGPTIFCLSIYC